MNPAAQGHAPEPATEPATTAPAQSTPTAAEPPAATAAPKRGGRCCLWSCGCLVLLVALLALAGWLGYLRYGAPWLEAQKTRLVERFPAAGALLQIRGLKDRLLEGVTVAGGEMGSERREDFPGDVFLPEGDIDALFNTTETTALAVLTYASTEPAALGAGIRRAMEADDWQRTPVDDPPDGIRLHFGKEERVAAYDIVGTADGVELWVKVSTAPRPPAEG